MHNAKKGGEFGANGEFYKGGQFVADTEDWVKGSSAFDAACKETVSVWYECHHFWTVEGKWVNGKFETEYAAVGNLVHGKASLSDWGEENTRLFFGYMLTRYLADNALRLPREEYWNCYAAAFGKDGLWLKNCKYRGKPVSVFVTLDADGLAAKRKEMEAAAADVRWYDDIMAEREAARKAAIVSKHIGTVGDKMELDVEVTGAIPFESDFGGGTVFKFIDADRNELVWMTSSAFNRMDGHEVEKGDKLRIKFTVKAHDHYDGVPQTKIVRVKAVA